VLTHPLRMLCDREGVFCGIRLLRCLSSAILFVVLCSRKQCKTLAGHQGTATAIPRPVAVFLCASASVWPPGGCLANLRELAQSPPRQTSARCSPNVRLETSRKIREKPPSAWLITPRSLSTPLKETAERDRVFAETVDTLKAEVKKDLRSPQTSSKFSLRIWLDKQTVLDHRNSVKLQVLSFSHGEPHPAAMRPWRRFEPT
jgi:hypothetical protein